MLANSNIVLFTHLVDVVVRCPLKTPRLSRRLLSAGSYFRRLSMHEPFALDAGQSGDNDGLVGVVDGLSLEFEWFCAKSSSGTEGTGCLGGVQSNCTPSLRRCEVEGDGDI